VGRVAMLILGLRRVLLTNERDGKGSRKTRRVERSRNGRCVFLIVDNTSNQRR